jgi:hypothetical protein
MPARWISLFEHLWNRDGSSGLELGVWRADAAGDAAAAAVSRDRLKLAEASDTAEASEGGDGRFSAWLMSASHLDAGSLSSITRTLPAFRGTTSWNLRRIGSNYGGKKYYQVQTASN